jgi:hypothetical protein
VDIPAFLTDLAVLADLPAPLDPFVLLFASSLCAHDYICTQSNPNSHSGLRFTVFKLLSDFGPNLTW